MAPPSCPNCHCFSPSEPLAKSHWSHLESQLRRNQPPSNIEIQTIASLERDIEGYDLEISRLQSVIVSLQLKRHLANDYVSKHKSLSSPIRRLPNEVLLEIFKIACGVDYQMANVPQFALSHVCSHWRSIVNASPILWSTFRKTFYNIDKCKARMSNVINMFLTKSMDRPLTLNLAYGDFTGDDDAFQLLLDQSHRWMDVTLRFNEAALSYTFAASGGFPRLERLDLVDGASPTKALRLGVIPRLRSLSINVAMIEANRRDLPWNLLRDVRLLGTTSSHCTDIFSWGTQLQYVTLLDGVLASDDLAGPIVSSTIVSVTLRPRVCVYNEQFFRLAQLPRLHTLQLEYGRFPSSCTYSFVAHSPLLTNITFKWLTFEHLDTVLGLLRLLPSVTNLFWQQDWSDVKWGTVHNLFSHLHPFNSKILLPRLQHFEMEISDPEKKVGGLDATIGSFVQMVRARWVEVEHPHERLRSVRLSFPHRCFNHDLIRPLDYLRKVGLRISIQDECGFIL